MDLRSEFKMEATVSFIQNDRILKVKPVHINVYVQAHYKTHQRDSGSLGNGNFLFVFYFNFCIRSGLIG